MISAHTKSYVLRAVVQKFLRQSWTCPAPVNKIVADKDSVSFRVGHDIGFVWAAIWHAMVGVRLAPFVRSRILGVNIVTEGLFLASL